MERYFTLKNFFDFYNVIAIVGIVILLSIILFPLPPYLIDLALALNFSVSILVLIMTMQVNKPLDFTGFPAYFL